MCNWFTKLKNKRFDEPDFTCPRDGTVMKKIKKKDVIIDVCPKCNGMWLDDQEIEKLVSMATNIKKKAVPKKKVKK